MTSDSTYHTIFDGFLDDSGEVYLPHPTPVVSVKVSFKTFIDDSHDINVSVGIFGCFTPEGLYYLKTNALTPDGSVINAVGAVLQGIHGGHQIVGPVGHLHLWSDSESKLKDQMSDKSLESSLYISLQIVF